MDNPSERIQELQDIQDQIIAFIKTHTNNGMNDDLAYALLNKMNKTLK